MHTPPAMLHPELLAPDGCDTIVRDGRRLDHAEAASKPLRAARAGAAWRQGLSSFRRCTRQQPLLRLFDTVIGIALGVICKWIGSFLFFLGVRVDERSS